MSEKVVYVTLGAQKVGRLALDREGRALFEYDSDWVRNGFSISPFHLPSPQVQKEVQNSEKIVHG